MGRHTGASCGALRVRFVLFNWRRRAMRVSIQIRRCGAIADKSAAAAIGQGQGSMELSRRQRLRRLGRGRRARRA
jgi:hypothetical protein